MQSRDINICLQKSYCFILLEEFHLFLVSDFFSPKNCWNSLDQSLRMLSGALSSNRSLSLKSGFFRAPLSVSLDTIEGFNLVIAVTPIFASYSEQWASFRLSLIAIRHVYCKRFLSNCVLSLLQISIQCLPFHSFFPLYSDQWVSFEPAYSWQQNYSTLVIILVIILQFDRQFLSSCLL